jgi:hypothetical protein
MAKNNRTTLKGFFETGKIPSQQNYVDLIDSTLNLSEASDGIQVTSVTASSDIKMGSILISNDLSSLKGMFAGTTTSDTLIARLPTINDTQVGNLSQSTILYGSNSENTYGHGTGFSIILGNASNVNTAVAGDLTVVGDTVKMANLPTSDPGTAGEMFTQTAVQLGGSGTTKVICLSAG